MSSVRLTGSQGRQRGEPRTGRQSTVQVQRNRDELRQWEHDWREGITKGLGDVTKSTADLALIVRDLQAEVHDLKEWKGTLDKRRNERDDRRPELRRTDLALLISAAVFALYVINDLISVVAVHWKP